VPSTAAPQIFHPNNTTNSSQQQISLLSTLFSIFFTTFRPELLFAFTRTQFIAAFELTRL
jgi:hypothetical protein